MEPVKEKDSATSSRRWTLISFVCKKPRCRLDNWT